MAAFNPTANPKAELFQSGGLLPANGTGGGKYSAQNPNIGSFLSGSGFKKVDVPGWMNGGGPVYQGPDAFYFPHYQDVYTGAGENASYDYTDYSNPTSVTKAPLSTLRQRPDGSYESIKGSTHYLLDSESGAERESSVKGADYGTDFGTFLKAASVVFGGGYALSNLLGGAAVEAGAAGAGAGAEGALEAGVGAAGADGAAAGFTGLPFGSEVPAGLGYSSGVTGELGAYGGLGAGTGFGQTLEGIMAELGSAGALGEAGVNLGTATGGDMDAAFSGTGMGGGAGAALNPNMLQSLAGLFKSGGMSTEAFKGALSSPGSLFSSLFNSGGGTALRAGGSLMQVIAGLEGRKRAKQLAEQMRQAGGPVDVGAAMRSIDGLGGVGGGGGSGGVGLPPELLALPNPNDIKGIPGYQAGEEAVRRSMASQGYQGSGNMMAALSKYGGDFYDKHVRQVQSTNQQRLEAQQQAINLDLNRKQQAIALALAQRQQQLAAAQAGAGPATGSISSLALLAQGLGGVGNFLGSLQ